MDLSIKQNVSTLGGRVLLSIIFISSLLVSVSNAQFFPRTGDEDKIESETKEAEEVEKIEIEKQKNLDEIKKKSEERIKQFEEIRKELRKQYYSDVNKKESRETLAALLNSDNNYWRKKSYKWFNNRYIITS